MYESREAVGMRLMIDAHRRSWWLLSSTEAPPVPFRRVLPSLLAVPSLACSVASLSLCPGGYLPDQHPLQSTGLAGCQIAWDTSSTWSEKHTLELQLLHLQAHCGRHQLAAATVSLQCAFCSGIIGYALQSTRCSTALALQAARWHGPRLLLTIVKDP